MVNNTTNVKKTKTNKHLSPQTIIHKKNQQHMALEIYVLAWDVDFIGVNEKKQLYFKVNCHFTYADF